MEYQIDRLIWMEIWSRFSFAICAFRFFVQPNQKLNVIIFNNVFFRLEKLHFLLLYTTMRSLCVHALVLFVIYILIYLKMTGFQRQQQQQAYANESDTSVNPGFKVQ